MILPQMPTPTERTRHEVDHIPCAAWCRSCVAGKGKDDGHFEDRTPRRTRRTRGTDAHFFSCRAHVTHHQRTFVGSRTCRLF